MLFFEVISRTALLNANLAFQILPPKTSSTTIGYFFITNMEITLFYFYVSFNSSDFSISRKISDIKQWFIQVPNHIYP